MILSWYARSEQRFRFPPQFHRLLLAMVMADCAAAFLLLVVAVHQHRRFDDKRLSKRLLPPSVPKEKAEC
jgi:hypothetical protein